MSKALKHMLATQLEDDLKASTGVLLVDAGPMTVETVSAFRTDLREKAGGARLRVIHNRTARVAFERVFGTEGAEHVRPLLQGPSAVVVGGDGPISTAKVVRDWRKKFKELRVKGAVADGEMLGEADALALAEMPDLPQLKSMLLAAIIGSGRGIAVSLQSVYGGIARALQARIDATGSEEEVEGSE